MSDGTSKVILDRNNSSILLNAASRESDLASPLDGVNDALMSLLLFDEAEITVDSSESREAGIERLRAEGIALLVPKQSFREPCRLIESYARNVSSRAGSEERFTARAQEHSFRALWSLIQSNDSSLKGADFDSIMLELRMWAHQVSSSADVFQRFFTEYGQRFYGESIFGLPSRLEFQGSQQFMAELEQHLDWDEFSEPDERKRFADEIRRWNESVPTFLSKYAEMRGLIERSTRSGYPIITSFGDARHKLDYSLGPEAIQLCRVHLDEVRSVPYLRTLDDLLRLRGNPYLADFRESLFEWLSRIRAGEANVEQKYRDQIRLANKQIEKLDKWRPLDSPYTLAAGIAVGIAEIFTGTFAGFGFSIAAGGAMIHKNLVSQKHGYALFRP